MGRLAVVAMGLLHIAWFNLGVPVLHNRRAERLHCADSSFEQLHHLTCNNCQLESGQ
jgi:hypothetical protein